MTRAVAIAGLLAVIPSLARAHGPNPTAQAVLVDESDPEFVYVATNVFGHFVSHDGGATFDWICSDVFASGNIETFPIDGAALAGSQQRVLLVAGSAGLARSSDDGCSWTVVDPFEGRRTTSLAVDAGNPDHVLVATDLAATDSTENVLFESNDAGSSFTPMSLSGPYLFRSPRFGPDGSIWVASLHRDEQVSYLHHSTDGGASFEAVALPDLGTRTYSIAAFGDEADTVLLRAGTAADDALVLATMAGAETSVVLEAEQPLYQMRRTLDGQLEIGAADGSAWRSPDGGQTWDPRPEGPARLCYAQRGGSLYACGRQLEDRLAVSVSPDDGDTWSTFFAYEQMTGTASCLESGAAQTCTVGDRLLAQCFELDEWGVDVAQIDGCPPLPTFGDETGSGQAGGDETGDTGGVTQQSEDGGSGCGCRSGADGAPALLLLGVVVGCRRRYNGRDA